MNDVSTQSPRGIVDNSNARRSTNLKVALYFAGLGIPVFPSSGKTPLIKGFNRLDTTLTSEEIARYTAQYVEENKDRDRRNQTPIHVGATTNIEVVKRMFRRYRDAVPSIACGPAGIVVLDADQKDDGPAKLVAKFKEHLAEISAPRITTQSGGFHAYYANDGTYTNKAGALKKDCGTDVRGMGGQTVAPGAWREDGKRYGTERDMLALGAAWKAGLPKLPTFITEMIAQGGSESAVPLSDADPIVKELMKRLGAGEWPDFEVTFDADVGKYCLDCIRERAPEFGELYDAPGADRSTNRFQMARYLVGAIPRFTVEEYASFCERWEGAGDFTSRDLAREFAKAVRSPARVPTDGGAFGAVEGEDDAPEDAQAVSKAGTVVRRFDYIEDLIGAPLRFLEWAIKFFIARGTTSIVSGLWGAGKTAVFADIALHIAHGFEWRGRKVRKGVVVYVALENANDVERRVSAWHSSMDNAGHDVQGGAFVLHRGPCRLFDPTGKPTRDEKDLIVIANEAGKHYGLPVAMVVIDTLSQSIAPGDDKVDGGVFTAAMQRIVAATGANVTALHHPTKAGQDVRGDGALQGNVDTIIVVARDGSGSGSIKAGSKYRIGDPGKVNFRYRLKPLVIGHDEDGDEIGVVLAVEDARGASMGIVDIDDDDVPMLKRRDKMEDRVEMLIEVGTEVAGKFAAEGEALREVALDVPQLFKAMNAYRAQFASLEGKPLPPLDKKNVWRVAQAALAAGRLTSKGTRYFLAA